MKVMLSGASGLLGSAIIEAMAELGAGSAITPFNRSNVFHSSRDELAQQLSGHDWFIHAAANTNVEQCEIDPDGCYRDNLLLTEILARAAWQAGVRFAFISSTGVYGSAGSEPYREYQNAQPTTHHHRSKYRAEKIVGELHADNLIVRTGWLFGGDPVNPKNFVARRIDEARVAQGGSGTISSNAEQRGVPCYNRDIAERILLLIKLGHGGLFNCVNSGNASRFEYVSAIIAASTKNVIVQPTSAGNFNRKAQVSNNEMALNWKMDQLGLPAMPAWQDSLRSYLENFF